MTCSTKNSAICAPKSTAGPTPIRRLSALDQGLSLVDKVKPQSRVPNFRINPAVAENSTINAP
jgi:hypothetical protein